MGLMTLQKVEQAALNNAVWCDTVCESHGCAGEFVEGAWLNWQQTPPFYPNAVTLGGARQAPLHQEHIRESIRVGVPVGWGIKDSFKTLQLNSLGFHILLEAQWIYKSVPVQRRTMDLAGVQWETVATASVLSEWERAWCGESGRGGIFLPALLQNADVAILAARRDGRIVAGCIANRASGCVGMSNIFLPAQGAHELRRECVAKVHEVFAELLIVGYESGSDLEAMLATGFEAIGGLRVWLRGNEAQGH